MFPGETLTTSIWHTEPGHAVFRIEASEPDGSDARLALEDGAAEYSADREFLPPVNLSEAR